jgi:hypothetical protein
MERESEKGRGERGREIMRSTHREKTMYCHFRKMVFCKPRRATSKGKKLANTFILDLYPPHCEKISFSVVQAIQFVVFCESNPSR